MRHTRTVESSNESEEGLDLCLSIAHIHKIVADPLADSARRVEGSEHGDNNNVVLFGQCEHFNTTNTEGSLVARSRYQ